MRPLNATFSGPHVGAGGKVGHLCPLSVTSQVIFEGKGLGCWGPILALGVFPRGGGVGDDEVDMRASNLTLPPR